MKQYKMRKLARKSGDLVKHIKKKKKEWNFAICNNMDRTGGYVSYLVK